MSAQRKCHGLRRSPRTQAPGVILLPSPPQAFCRVSRRLGVEEGAGAQHRQDLAPQLHDGQQREHQPQACAR